jgi:hypothetical protein
MFSVTIPADGVIRKAYTRAGGHGTHPQIKLEMTGNEKARELEILDTDTCCYYKVTPD